MTPAMACLLAVAAVALFAGAAEAVSTSAHRGDLVLVKQALYSSDFQVYTPGGKRRFSLPTYLQKFARPLKTAVSLDGKLAFTTIDNGSPRYGYEPGTKLYDLLVTRISGGVRKHEGRFNIPGLGKGALKGCTVVSGRGPSAITQTVRAGSGAIAAGHPLKADPKSICDGISGCKPRYPVYVAVSCNTCSSGIGITASKSYILKLQYDSRARKLSSHGRILASRVSGGKCTENQAAAVKALSVQRRLGSDALFAIIMEQNGKTFAYQQLTGKTQGSDRSDRPVVTRYTHSNDKCYNFAASTLGSFLAVCPSGTKNLVIRVAKSINGKHAVTTTTHGQTVGTLPGSNRIYAFGTSGSQGGPATVNAIFSFDKAPLGRDRRKNFNLAGTNSFYDITVVP